MSTKAKAREKTVDESRAEFLSVIRAQAQYWADDNLSATVQERCDGVAFAILCVLDGVNMAFPALNLTLAPHPSDKAYGKENGENWHKPGACISDCELHDLYWKQEGN
jgi:hypothetical protein